MLVRTTLTVLAAAATLAVPAGAGASAIGVIRDCTADGKLDKHYSQKELSSALAKLPSDIDEYTDCRTVIRQAQLAGARGKTHRGTGIAGHVDQTTPPSAAEQNEINQASKSSGAVDVGGKRISPGAPATLAGFGTQLPPLVLAALIGLGAAMASGATVAARRRWPRAWQAAGATLGDPLRRIGEGVKRGISRIRR